MKKRILSLVLAVVLALCLLPATAYAATTASGACGKNLTWSLSSTGTLTISGKGAMAEYDSGKMPWIAYKNQIKSVVLAKGITSIAYLSFSRYTKLTSVQIPDSVTDIGASAFDNCTALSDMTLPKNLKTLGWLAFAGCSSLKTLTMPASLTEGGGSAFSKCTGLKEVYFEKGSKAVEFEQFRFCTSLEKVVLPAGLERIGIDAFTGCTSLKSLSIPASVAEIGKYPARSCTSLQEITVASGNRYYTSQNGALYTKDMKTLIQYPGGRTGGVVIPQGVETLHLDSISCPGMTSILLPVSLKLIASAAFYGCDHLTDVYYAGTKAQWALVDNKGSMNEALNQAKIHYNYKNALPPVTAKAEYIASTGKPYLKWTAVDGANRYYVYRSTTKDGTYSFLGSTAKLNYTDSKADAGTTYYYKVKAGIVNGVKSNSSAAVAITCRCARPVVKPSYVGASGKPYIYWSAVDGAGKYYVYRSTSKDGTYEYIGYTTKTNYTDSKANAGYTYYYKVQAISSALTMAKVYLSPSNQTDNCYAYGNTNEAVQCGKIADSCRIALERSGVTVQVGHMPSMQDKCKESNAFGADLHVPIHTNAFNGTVTGTRMFCLNSSGEGMKACEAIFAWLAPITPGTSENIQVDASLYEVRVPSAPAAYVECEFHDNATTAKWIVEHTVDIGEAIARGICDYFGVTFKEKEQPKPAATTDKLYRVQVGAFAVRANAERMLRRLKDAGFEGYIRE